MWCVEIPKDSFWRPTCEFRLLSEADWRRHAAHMEFGYMRELDSTQYGAATVSVKVRKTRRFDPEPDADIRVYLLPTEVCIFTDGTEETVVKADDMASALKRAFDAVPRHEIIYTIREVCKDFCRRRSLQCLWNAMFERAGVYISSPDFVSDPQHLSRVFHGGRWVSVNDVFATRWNKLFYVNVHEWPCVLVHAHYLRVFFKGCVGVCAVIPVRELYVRNHPACQQWRGKPLLMLPDPASLDTAPASLWTTRFMLDRSREDCLPRMRCLFDSP
jgi:hypothetical protein